MSIYEGEVIMMAKRARRVYGDDDSLRAGAEEATELSLAAQHHRRRLTPGSLAELATEIADVEITLARMHLLFESDEDFKLLFAARMRQRDKYAKGVETAEQEMFERGELSDHGESKP